jgi:hypothetical protein
MWEATFPPVASTTSELPADPLMLMSLTVVAGRVLVVAPEDTETSPPDEPIVIELPAGAEAAQISRNVIDEGPVENVVVAPVSASVEAIEAVMLTAPYATFVT